jgi:hypothetical protein
MGLIEWLWRFLPDRCEMPGCSRQGVRGNENVILGKRVCDSGRYFVHFGGRLY